jgi:hypothetical protein
VNPSAAPGKTFGDLMLAPRFQDGEGHHVERDDSAARVALRLAGFDDPSQLY